MGKGRPLIAGVVLLWCATSWSSTDSDNWSFKVRLYTPRYRDLENYIGVWPGCNQGYDSEDAVEPPTLPGRPNVSMPTSDGALRLAMDLRSPVLLSESWTLEAENLEAEGSHSLVFDYVDDAPEIYDIVFEDLTTGETRDLRAAPEYVFVSGPGETNRKFQVTVTTKTPAPPGDLVATRTFTGGTVSWSPSPSPNVAGYQVYIGTDSGTIVDSWFVGSKTSISVAGLHWFTQYYVAVSSVDEFSREGDLSGWVRMKPKINSQYDVTQSGTLERDDVFALAANWMGSNSGKTGASEAAEAMVFDAQFLHGFVETWQAVRIPDGALPAADSQAPVTETDMEFLSDLLRLTQVSAK